MIGKVIIGKSYRGCIQYCLSNKESQAGMEQRAEVLDYNFCHGKTSEIDGQFKDVGNLNPKLSNKVMHITLSFPPGERPDPEKLKSIADECALKFEFDKNQYIVVLHKDTGHQHIHIVINRVGYGGKTVSDSNSYKRMSDFCREMEKKYNLTPVVSPKKYQSRQQRSEPRQDKRKEKLRSDIQKSLSRSKSYEQFQKIMKSLEYEVIKGRGIAFRDRKKVYTKGSEVGYPRSKIEKIFNSETQSRALTPRQNLARSKEIANKLLSKNSRNALLDLTRNNPVNELVLLHPTRKKKRRKRSL